MKQFPAGFYPFWFWNDRLTSEEIRWQVAQMAAQGVRGFFIHSRQGLKDPPYLSEQFMDRVADAVEAAQEYGLVVHLYDEYPYPSGAAGGLVPLGQPQFQATCLEQSCHDLDGGPLRLELAPGKLLSLLAFPLREDAPDFTAGLNLLPAAGMVLDEDIYQETGLTSYNRKRFFSGRPRPVLQTTLPAGRWRVFSAVQRVVERHKYWGSFTDVLNPEAVRQFLSETHERYRRRFGARFGSSIGWIFTDEVVPEWSAALPEAFLQHYGYELPPLLPALLDPRHPQHLRLAADLHDLKYNLFRESFEEPVSAWCRAAGIAYAAEKPSLRFSQLRYQDIPGCEPGHVKAGARLDLLQPSLRGNARAAASAAYFYGKAGALDECYHSLGWSATLEDVRWMADAQLLLGVRYLVPHGFFYSTHALRKHDAPPSLFFQAPYWPLFHHLSQRVETIARAFEGTWIDAGLVVVDPTAGLPTAEDAAAYETLLHGLMAAHIDFHIVDTDVLQDGEIGAGTVRLRDINARAVLVPPLRRLEAPLAAWLEQFTRAGGKVLRLEQNFALAPLLTELSRLTPPSLSLRSAGQENGALWSVCRRSAHKTAWFILNVSGEPQTVELACRGPLHEQPLSQNTAPCLRASAAGYRRSFAPFEACLLVAAPAPMAAELPTVSVDLSGPLALRPLQPNLARLNDWRLDLLAEDGALLQSAPVTAAPLANQLEMGGFRFAPRFERVFGAPPELRLPPLSLRYTCEFELAVSVPLELVMEPGSLAGDWRILVNSVPLDPAAFGPSQAHTRGSLGQTITPWLRPGLNTLSVELHSAEADGGLLNPLYLAGSFGVELEPLRLVAPRQTGVFEAYRANGLPFYAGVLEYRAEVEIPTLPQAPATLVEFNFPEPFHQACAVSLNAGPWRDLPWGPYTLEIDPAELRPGANHIRLRVYTSLIRAFEGQVFDYSRHRTISVAHAS